MTPISNDSAVVTAEHKLDHRLIFRATLALAKWRLAIAALVFGLLTDSLIYFFVLIEEQEILWQTSPLFIGIPLMGIGGQLLRLHAVSRKYASSLPPSQRVVRYAFRYALIAWSEHFKALEKTGYFLLFHNRYDVSVIPKSAFEPHGIPTFRKILRSKLGDRAQVAHN